MKYGDGPRSSILQNLWHKIEVVGVRKLMQKAPKNNVHVIYIFVETASSSVSPVAATVDANYSSNHSLAESTDSDRLMRFPNSKNAFGRDRFPILWHLAEVGLYVEGVDILLQRTSLILPSTVSPLNRGKIHKALSAE
ncbi:hypothetical protein NQZ68_016566 [Dissostichus eleginoides]|nr:hypothetical protein NQZ68_016566 [Dissostichus eleginoides]